MTLAVLKPGITTGGRSVFPNGRDTAPFIWLLGAFPLIGIVVALADERSGLKLFMSGIAVTFLIMIVGLYARNRALRTGVIRIESDSELRFMPPPYLWIATLAVTVGLIIPGLTMVLIDVFDLPMMQLNTRLTTFVPLALGVGAIVAFAYQLWSSRVPAGLTVGPERINGVRGTKRASITWDELVMASTLGDHGPKLLLVTQAKSAVVIDAHHLGSDPAIVAAVLEYYRTHPRERARLSNGAEAIRAVADATRK